MTHDEEKPTREESGLPLDPEGNCIGCGAPVDPPLQICSACAEHDRTP